MKKLLIFFLFLFLTSPSYALWGKKKEAPVLFLSAYDPKTSSEFDRQLENHSVFRTGQRIYFLIYTKEGFSSDYIKYQIVKQDDNAHVGGYSRIRNITRRVSDKNSYVDYFVLSQPGKYIIQIFDITNLHHWLAVGQFRVVNE